MRTQLTPPTVDEEKARTAAKADAFIAALASVQRAHEDDRDLIVRALCAFYGLVAFDQSDVSDKVFEVSR